MEREVGGVIGMGNTCKSMADSFQCMTKPTTIWNDYKTFTLMSVTNLENTETLGNRKMVIKLRRKERRVNFQGF